MIKNTINNVKNKIYDKVSAMVGIAAIMGLAFMLGMRHSASPSA
jgi:hypothetical protein